MVSTLQYQISTDNFDPTSPKFIQVCKCNFSYNRIFVLEGIRLNIKSQNVTIKFDYNWTNISSSYKNIEGIHDRFVEGQVKFDLPYFWSNEIIYVEVFVSSNGKHLRYNSAQKFIDYKELFRGTTFVEFFH